MARILADLSKASVADLLKALEAQGVNVNSGKDETPAAAVVDHTPKKGKDVGKTVKRLKISGNNVYPMLLNQKSCILLAQFGKEIASFAKAGKWPEGSKSGSAYW